MTSTTKVCRLCGQSKDASAYNRKSKSPDGLDAWCRDCAKSRAADRAAAGHTRTRKSKTPPGLPASTPTAVAGQLSTPATDFRPNREVLATFAANQAGVRAGLHEAGNFLWIGPSGSGKTEAARDLARRANLDFYKVDAPAMTDPEAWFGTREVRVRDGAPETVYNPSLFATSIQTRCLLLVDEGNRVPDAIRQILLALWDDSRTVTNPLTGQTIRRHPECFVVMTANVGLAFTGTFAIDPAFYTRSMTTRFNYLNPADETALARSRTGVDADNAALIVRLATETRLRNAQSEDFPPMSTREVLMAASHVAMGLDANTAVHQAVINAAPNEGGVESIQGQLELIWTGIQKAPDTSA